MSVVYTRPINQQVNRLKYEYNYLLNLNNSLGDQVEIKNLLKQQNDIARKSVVLSQNENNTIQNNILKLQNNYNTLYSNTEILKKRRSILADEVLELHTRKKKFEKNEEREREKTNEKIKELERLEERIDKKIKELREIKANELDIKDIENAKDIIFEEPPKERKLLFQR